MPVSRHPRDERSVSSEHRVPSKHRPPRRRHLDLRHSERVEWHYHAEHQLVYPSSGVLSVSTSAGSWVVPPQRAVWLPAGVAHSHQAHGPTRMHSLFFDPPADPLGAVQPTVISVSPLMREVLIVLTDTAAERTPADRTAAERTAVGRTAAEREHLEAVAFDQLRRCPAEPLHLPEPGDDRLRAISAILHEDPGDPRTLAELGRAVGAGERTLTRLFRQQVGMTFPQWRTQLRLHRALIRITQGDPVTTVAVAVGFANPSAFIAAFKAMFGDTPGAYQRTLGT
ncbi:MAG: helix-turn-helix transcriptional regulator [Nocardiopsaceae bacterium]|nr:helix-turn-helix transcriptional regulator [Nocardiopsaceae bacterium]